MLAQKTVHASVAARLTKISVVGIDVPAFQAFHGGYVVEILESSKKLTSQANGDTRQIRRSFGRFHILV
jgi:hypothetical protein